MEEEKLYLSGEYEAGNMTKHEQKRENSLQNQMVAMSKALARASKNLSIEEYKLLVMGMTKINWRKEDNNLEVVLSKIEIEQMMGWKADPDQRSKKIRQLAKKLVMHSYIQINGKDKDEWDDGVLLTRMRSTRGDLHLYFAEQFRPMLENLLKDKDFITIWANDVYHFKSVYSYLLFEDLRLNCDTRKMNYREYTTKQLKELLGIPKDGRGSYMRSKENGGFNRSLFEQKVLDMAIDEINSGQMMTIYPILGTPECRKHKCYEKIKKDGYISGYRFKYNVKTRTKDSLTIEEQINLQQDD